MIGWLGLATLVAYASLVTGAMALWRIGGVLFREWLALAVVTLGLGLFWWVRADVPPLIGVLMVYAGGAVGLLGVWRWSGRTVSVIHGIDEEDET